MHSRLRAGHYHGEHDTPARAGADGKSARDSSEPATIPFDPAAGESMALSVYDRLAIHELISLHGHLSDDRQFSRFKELFTDDIVYDLEDFGMGTHRGLEAL